MTSVPVRIGDLKNFVAHAERTFERNEDKMVMTIEILGGAISIVDDEVPYEAFLAFAQKEGYPRGE